MQSAAVLLELKQEILYYMELCQYKNLNIFPFWKNLHWYFNSHPSLKPKMKPFQLRTFFVRNMLMELWSNHFELTKEVSQIICYQFLFDLCNWDVEVNEAERPINTALKDDWITRPKLLIKYLLSEGEFVPEIWEAVQKFVGESRKHFYININHPIYGLNENEKKILRKYVIRSRKRKLSKQQIDVIDTNTNWMSKNDIVCDNYPSGSKHKVQYLQARPTQSSFQNIAQEIGNLRKDECPPVSNYVEDTLFEKRNCQHISTEKNGSVITNTENQDSSSNKENEHRISFPETFESIANECENEETLSNKTNELMKKADIRNNSEEIYDLRKDECQPVTYDQEDTLSQKLSLHNIFIEQNENLMNSDENQDSASNKENEHYVPYSEIAQSIINNEDNFQNAAEKVCSLRKDDCAVANDHEDHVLSQQRHSISLEENRNLMHRDENEDSSPSKENEDYIPFTEIAESVVSKSGNDETLSNKQNELVKDDNFQNNAVETCSTRKDKEYPPVSNRDKDILFERHIRNISIEKNVNLKNSNENKDSLLNKEYERHMPFPDIAQSLINKDDNEEESSNKDNEFVKDDCQNNAEGICSLRKGECAPAHNHQGDVLSQKQKLHSTSLEENGNPINRIENENSSPNEENDHCIPFSQTSESVVSNGANERGSSNKEYEIMEEDNSQNNAEEISSFRENEYRPVNNHEYTFFQRQNRYISIDRNGHLISRSVSEDSLLNQENEYHMPFSKIDASLINKDCNENASPCQGNEDHTPFPETAENLINKGGNEEASPNNDNELMERNDFQNSAEVICNIRKDKRPLVNNHEEDTLFERQNRHISIDRNGNLISRSESEDSLLNKENEHGMPFSEITETLLNKDGNEEALPNRENELMEEDNLQNNAEEVCSLREDGYPLVNNHDEDNLAETPNRHISIEKNGKLINRDESEGSSSNKENEHHIPFTEIAESEISNCGNEEALSNKQNGLMKDDNFQNNAVETCSIRNDEFLTANNHEEDILLERLNRHISIEKNENLNNKDKTEDSLLNKEKEYHIPFEGLSESLVSKGGNEEQSSNNHDTLFEKNDNLTNRNENEDLLLNKENDRREPFPEITESLVEKDGNKEAQPNKENEHMNEDDFQNIAEEICNIRVDEYPPANNHVEDTLFERQYPQISLEKNDNLTNRNESENPLINKENERRKFFPEITESLLNKDGNEKASSNKQNELIEDGDLQNSAKEIFSVRKDGYSSVSNDGDDTLFDRENRNIPIEKNGHLTIMSENEGPLLNKESVHHASFSGIIQSLVNKDGNVKVSSNKEYELMEENDSQNRAGEICSTNKDNHEEHVLSKKQKRHHISTTKNRNLINTNEKEDLSLNQENEPMEDDNIEIISLSSDNSESENGITYDLYDLDGTSSTSNITFGDDIRNAIVYFIKIVGVDNIKSTNFWNKLYDYLQYKSCNITCDWQQLENYFYNELIYDIKDNKTNLDKEDANYICYNFLLELCNFNVVVLHSNKASSKFDEIHKRGLIIKYLLSESYNAEIYAKLLELSSETLENIFINLNHPLYNLSSSQKEKILQKFRYQTTEVNLETDEINNILYNKTVEENASNAEDNIETEKLLNEENGESETAQDSVNVESSGIEKANPLEPDKTTIDEIIDISDESNFSPVIPYSLYDDVDDSDLDVNS